MVVKKITVKKRKYLSKGAMIAIALLFILSAGAYTSYRHFLARDLKQEKVHAAEVKRNASLNEKTSPKLITYDLNDVVEVSADDVVAANFRNARGTSKKILTGGMYMPDTNIHLGIFKGFYGDNQYLGACTYYDAENSSERQLGKGNYVLVGHNMASRTSLFAPLKNSKIGSYVYLTDYQEVFTFRVTSNDVFNDTRTDLLEDIPDDETPICTLVTCYGGAGTKRRRIVKGELIEQKTLSNSPAHVKEAFQVN
ncbi:class A sortase [Enterococcus sp. AZ072]|uniref:class A sortase n=1 Tax=unclassified Enterococcus TaxID=2608891 RepID=UPI003D2E00CE